jgi:hypothetical protein
MSALEEHAAQREALHLLCGRLLGVGSARHVYECALNSEWVVKVETGARSFQNALEWEFWQDAQANKELARWLAPCHHISPSGVVLIQARTTDAPTKAFPKKVPKVFTDLKYQNWGYLLGDHRRLVCHDYALTLNYTTGLRQADWWGL